MKPFTQHTGLVAPLGLLVDRLQHDGFDAWRQGRTGIPIVDAGMRELWCTGYMHNRVRMITASFLVKNLLQDWRHGERWFWNSLLDADLGAAFRVDRFASPRERDHPTAAEARHGPGPPGCRRGS